MMLHAQSNNMVSNEVLSHQIIIELMPIVVVKGVYCAVADSCLLVRQCQQLWM
jgi:hypothetical protein